VADQQCCFVAFSIAAWKPILIPALFGCDQMEVCDSRKKGKIWLLKKNQLCFIVLSLNIISIM